MLDATDMPDWAVERLQRCIEVFGLSQWYISLDWADKPGGDDSMLAVTYIDARYRNANIELQRGTTEEKGKKALIHEALHVAFGPMEQAIIRIKEVVPSKLQKHAEELYNDALEQSIEGLARAMSAHFEAEP